MSLPSGPGGCRQRSKRTAIRHRPDLRLRGRGLAGRQPQLHRYRQLWRRPRLRLPQRLGTTLPETGQHVRPALRRVKAPVERRVRDAHDQLGTHRSRLWGYFSGGFKSSKRFKGCQGKRLFYGEPRAFNLTGLGFYWGSFGHTMAGSKVWMLAQGR